MRILWVTTLMLLGTTLSLAQAPQRLAVYYGYPSAVNDSRGDVQKAAAVFSAYDVVVLGDGLEFSDRQPNRTPPGDPVEHQRVIQIIAAARAKNPNIKFYGYVPLGDYQHLKLEQIIERINLWKPMGVSSIFLDEAGYDYKNVTRELQNGAVNFAHQLGLGVCMNGYFLDHIFSPADNLPNSNGGPKNPKHLPSALDHRDLFLIESFQISNGAYEDAAHWRARMKQAVDYRRRFGARIFAVTTATDKEPFNAEKFNYAWWSAWMYGVDGFGWGEPNFSASNNSLPARSCASFVKGGPAIAPGADPTHLWKKSGNSVIVLDTAAHSVQKASGAPSLTGSSRPGGTVALSCGSGHE